MKQLSRACAAGMAAVAILGSCRPAIAQNRPPKQTARDETNRPQPKEAVGARKTVPPVRLAVVDVGSRSKVPGAFVDLLVAALANHGEIDLLERAEIARLLREQSLSLSLSNPVKSDEAVKAGKLWAVDTFLMLETAKDARGPWPVRVRLVDARHGVKLADFGLVLDAGLGNAADQAELLARAAARKVAAVSRNLKDLHLVGVLVFQNEELTDRLNWLSETLPAGIETHLALAPGVALMERGRTRTLTAERLLAQGLPEALRPAAVVVTGSFRLDRARGPDALSVHVRCRRGAREVLDRTVAGSVRDPGALAKEMARVVEDRLAGPGGGDPMSPVDEARLLAQTARSYVQRLDVQTPDLALPPAQAALALEPQRDEYRLLVMHILEKQLVVRESERPADGGKQPDVWPPVLAYYEQVLPLAEAMAGQASLSTDADAMSELRNVLGHLKVAWGRHAFQHQPTPEGLDGELAGIRRGLRATYGKALAGSSASPLCRDLLVVAASRSGYSWQDSLEDALAFSRGTAAEAARLLRKRVNGLLTEAVTDAVFFSYLDWYPPWSGRKDRRRVYLQYLEELARDRDPVLRIAAELALVRYLSTGPADAVDFARVRKHYGNLARLVREELPTAFPDVLPESRLWIMAALEAGRFASIRREEEEYTTRRLEEYLDFVLQDQRRFGSLVNLEPLVARLAGQLEKLGKSEEAIRFLRRHARRIKDGDLAANDQPDLLANMLRDLERKQGRVGEVAEPPAGPRAVVLWDLKGHPALFKEKGWAPAGVVLRRLVLGAGVAAVVCTQEEGQAERYGLLRLDPKTLRPVSFQALPEAVPFGTAEASNMRVQEGAFGPGAWAEGEDVYVGSLFGGVIIFPGHGPPRRLGQKDGLASELVGSLAVLDGKIYACVGSEETGAGLMAADPATGKSDLIFSSKSPTSRQRLEGVRPTSVVADPKRHCLWLGLSSEPGTLGVLAAYYPATDLLVKKLQTGWRVDPLRTDQGHLIVSSGLVATMDLASGRFARLAGAEAFGQFAGPRRLAVPAGPQIVVAYCDTQKTSLYAVRPGKFEHRPVLASWFPTAPADRLSIRDLNPSARGLLVLAADALYVVPQLKGPLAAAPDPAVPWQQVKTLFTAADLPGIRQVCAYTRDGDDVFAVCRSATDDEPYLQLARVPLGTGKAELLGKIRPGFDLGRGPWSCGVACCQRLGDKVYVGTEADGLYVFDLRGGPGRKVPYPGSKYVTALAVLGDRLYASYFEDLVVINTEGRAEALASGKRKEIPSPFAGAGVYFCPWLLADARRQRVLFLVSDLGTGGASATPAPSRLNGLWQYDVRAKTFSRLAELYWTAGTLGSAAQDGRAVIAGPFAALSLDLANDRVKTLWATRPAGPGLPATTSGKGPTFLGRSVVECRGALWFASGVPFGRLDLATGRHEILPPLMELREGAVFGWPSFLEVLAKDELLVGDLFGLRLVRLK